MELLSNFIWGVNSYVNKLYKFQRPFFLNEEIKIEKKPKRKIGFKSNKKDNASTSRHLETHGLF